MTINEAEQLALNLMDQHGLIQDGWTFDFTNRKHQLGVCYYDKKHIALSKHHVLADTDEDVNDTILHEIAHALVGPDNGHNNLWKKKAKSIGCNGNRCKESRIKYKYIAQCPVCHYEYPAHRRTAGSCGRCSDTYDDRFKFIYKEN